MIIALRYAKLDDGKVLAASELHGRTRPATIAGGTYDDLVAIAQGYVENMPLYVTSATPLSVFAAERLKRDVLYMLVDETDRYRFMPIFQQRNPK